MSATELLRELAWKADYVDVVKRGRLSPPRPLKTPRMRLVEFLPMHPDNEAAVERHGDLLGPRQVQEIRDYKGTQSEEINRDLRGSRGGSAYGQDLMKSVTNNPMPQPQTLYRGNMMKRRMPVGHEFTDHGFTGTSLDRGTAASFGSEGGGKVKHRNMFVIHAPPGTRGHLLDYHHSDEDHEDEFLLHPGTHFRVIGHSEHAQAKPWIPGNTERVTHLAVVGQGHHADGRRDTSLTKSPEGRKWLSGVQSRKVRTVTDPAFGGTMRSPGRPKALVDDRESDYPEPEDDSED